MFSESEKALDTQREALIGSIMNDSNNLFNESLTKKKKKKSKKEKHEKTDEVAEDATTNHVITKESLTENDLTTSAKKKKKKHKKEKYENDEEAEGQGTKRKAEFSLDSPMVTTPVAKKAKKLSFDSSTPAILDNSQNEAPKSSFSFNLDTSPANKEKKKKKKDKKEKKQNGDINEAREMLLNNVLKKHKN